MKSARTGWRKPLAHRRLITCGGWKLLLAEHPLLLAGLDDLIQRGEGVLNGSVKQMLGDARSLTRRLAQHEAAETALLTDAVYADLGGG